MKGKAEETCATQILPFIVATPTAKHFCFAPVELSEENERNPTDGKNKISLAESEQLN